MKKQLPGLLLFSVFAFLLSGTCKAQVSAIPFTAALDSFSNITGTTLDGPMADDVVYQNIPIGFVFNLGGTNHSVMSVNTNGYVELDSTGTIAFFNILSGPRNNIVSPFGADLIHYNSNASLQYATIGTAPNRICIVQWLHYSYFGNSGDISFQLRMYETSNCIQFVYGANSYVATPLQTQIGMRGTNNLDFIALGDSTCNWANAYPYPSITTKFPVSLSCNMPSGFAFDFGSCGKTGGVNFAYLTGKVFNDNNGNGTLDSAETGISNHVVNILPGNYYVSSDGNGDYTFFFFDSTLTYTLSTGPITYWNQTNIPAILSVNPATQSCSGLNFGFRMIPNVHEVAIHCPNWGAKPGQPEPMPISYENNGTITENDTITFIMDSLYSFISATPAPTSVNGQTIQWAYSNLLPNGNGFIMLNLMPSLSGVLGNYLNSTLSIGPKNDTIPSNNILNLHQLITLAWDPNEKSAEPSGMIEAGTEINYTIHFQNTGNATADNVTIKDTLDSNLDLLSFNLTGASHSVNFKMDDDGVATFTFFNIQLPDSGANQLASNGFVNYSIKTKPTLPPLTVINNTAGIIFDFNPAVITNTTADTIQILLAVNNHSENNFMVNAIPNPVNDRLVFIFSENKLETADLKINSIEGRLMLQMQNIVSGYGIDIGSLSAGIYFCTIHTINASKTIKIIKQ